MTSHNASIYIQARMRATRLPGKPMKTVLGKPLLGFLVERMRRCKSVSKIVIATTVEPQDDLIAHWGFSNGIAVFRGSEGDVLDRFFQTSVHFPADPIVRVTADCPLLDPNVVDQAVQLYLKDSQYDYVSNSLVRFFPRGMDVEVLSLKCLQEAAKEASLPWEREHVTPFIYGHPDRYRIGQLLYDPDESVHRWTVDTPEDLILITKILEELYPKNPHFTLKDLLDCLHANPEWSEINAHIQQKKRNT